MQNTNFDEVINEILELDPRYHYKAYTFVREGLDHTLKARKKNASAARHVNGKELLEGIRDFALKEYGPMTKLVLEEWGIRECRDIGHIVFNLVEKGILGKSENDNIDDFADAYNFDDAFVKPYQPEKIVNLASSTTPGIKPPSAPSQKTRRTKSPTKSPKTPAPSSTEEETQ